MKNRFAKWLSALLIAALLLTPTALMEEAPTEATPVEVEAPEAEVLAEAVDIAGAEETADLTEDDELDLVADEEELVEASEPSYAGGVDIQTTFKDAAFRDFVSEIFDTDGDGELSATEIAAVTSIDLFKVDLGTWPTIQKAYEVGSWVRDSDGDPVPAGVSDLSGIEVFTALTNLNCDFNPLKSLNLSQSNALTMVHCNGCGLETLDVSGCADLENLWCNSNNLTQLSLEKNTKLAELACENNKLTELDISPCPALHQLLADLNGLTYLNIYNCPALLDAYQNATPTPDPLTVNYDYVDANGDWVGQFVVDINVEILTDKDAKPTVPAADDASTSTSTASTAASTAAPAPAAVVSSEPAAPAVMAIAATKARSSATILLGTTYQIDTAGKAAKGFKSSKKKVATVSSTGLVTPKKAGKTKITFKVGKKKRTVTLKVKDPTIPTKVYLNLSGTVAAKVGEPQILTVAVPEGTYSGIKWTSSNKKVATVKDGVVTFKKKGKVTITATATRGKKKAKVKFKVSK